MERPSQAQLLARRLAGNKSTRPSTNSNSTTGEGGGESGGGKFASPTDALMSPCTQKLRDNKGLLYKK